MLREMARRKNPKLKAAIISYHDRIASNLTFEGLSRLRVLANSKRYKFSFDVI